MKKNQQGFTLVELLVVIAIIVILFAVILVAVDPAGRLQQSRDAVRRQDVRNILEAIQQYVVDQNGVLSGLGLDSDAADYEVLGTDGAGCDSTCTAQTTIAACADISSALVDTYLAAMPVDPLTGSAGNSDYFANVAASGRIEIGACDPEDASTISVQR